MAENRGVAPVILGKHLLGLMLIVPVRRQMRLPLDGAAMRLEPLVAYIFFSRHFLQRVHVVEVGLEVEGDDVHVLLARPSTYKNAELIG